MRDRSLVTALRLSSRRSFRASRCLRRRCRFVMLPPATSSLTLHGFRRVRRQRRPRRAAGRSVVPRNGIEGSRHRLELRTCARSDMSGSSCPPHVAKLGDHLDGSPVETPCVTGPRLTGRNGTGRCAPVELVRVPAEYSRGLAELDFAGSGVVVCHGFIVRKSRC